MAGELIDDLGLALEARAKDEGDGPVAAGQMAECVDQVRAIDAALQVARQHRCAFGQGDGVGVAEEVGDQRTIARPSRGCRQRTTRDRGDQKEAGVIWRSREQMKTRPGNRR